MGKPSLKFRIRLFLKQLFCKHRIITIQEIGRTEKETGYGIYCSECDKTLCQVYFRK